MPSDIQVGCGEKCEDICTKLKLVGKVASSIVCCGEYSLGYVERKGPHGPYKVICFKQVPDCVGPAIRGYLRANGNAEWLVYKEERITFREAEQVLDQLGAELAGTFGVKAGTAVAIAMRNYPEYMMAFLAITAMGAVAIPLNSLWGTEELEYAVTDSGTKMIVGDIERLRLCKSFTQSSNIKTILCRGNATEAQEVGAAVWEDVVAAGKGKPYPSIKEVKPEDNVMIMYTSGSTGFPKGVVHSQRSMNFFLRVGQLSLVLLPDSAPVSLLPVPLFHITALAAVFLMSLPRCEKLVLMYKWDAGEALDLIEKEKCSRFTGVPTMVGDMLAHKNFTEEKVKTMKNMVAGGAPTPEKLATGLRSKAKNIKSGQGWALTETFALGTVNSGTDYLKNPSSCGKPLPVLVDLCIKDPSGKKLSAGSRGEVCIKGAMLMTGYQNKPEATADVFDKEGYFHTGDVGEMHGGFLFLKDRLKDIIIRAGENIDCSEVEAAFYKYGEAVREVSVFGLPDERLGEVVAACIWLEGDIPVDVLVAAAKSSLASFKVPAEKCVFIRREALPKGATGKIDKKGMREFYKSQMPPVSE